MHYVPKNYRQNGLGFIGPSINGGYITEGGAFTARRVYTPPQPAITTTPIVQPAPTTVRTIMPVQTSYYDPSRTFTYSREQIQQMRDAAIASQGELLERQGREGGDGIYDDLEQKAAEENATANAIAEGAALPTRVGANGVSAPQNLMPLILAAAAAYFFL